MSDEGKPANEKPGLFTMAWFKPIERRVIVIAVIVAWSAWEWFFNNEQIWQIASLAMLAYGVWTFFINYDKALAKETDAKPKS